ncbi:MAG TPA: DUF3179 domain-containing (seleno)protein [Gemmataceae bacterium]|nr:DUF3179 domain-containing (seleno)protein [Gemmataceae bacterium]
MLTIKRFISSLRFVARRRFLLMAGASMACVLLLGYYLHQTGNLLLPPALGKLFSSPSKAVEQPKESNPLSAADRKNARRPDFWPGLRLPPTRSAEEAGLAEDTEVIGVCVQGRARAYWVAALSGGPEFHVVNDVLGGRAVTVAYCDLLHCARVFTAASGGAPLDLGFGGWNERKGPMLQMGSVKYTLEDGKNLSQPQGPPLPYQRMEHQRTTWGEWRRAHPDTDVYVFAPPPP